MLGIISFSDRIAHNIKCNEHKDFILNQLNNLYNIKIIQKHHHNLDENNVNIALSQPHLMNLRSNGNRYYLYFTLYNDIEIIYFIDKKIHPGYQKPRIILDRGLFDKSLFKNTLLDGEMVKCHDNTWTFLINDIISYEGHYLNGKSLPDRLKIVYHILENQYTPDETIDVCNYKVKNYFYINNNGLSEIINLSKKLNYTCRGIYLWSYNLKHKPKLYNFDESTIVEVIRKTKDTTGFQSLDNIQDVVEVFENVSNDIKDVVKEIVNDKEIEDSNNERVFCLVKTIEPDIYKMYENENVMNGKCFGIALVQSLQVSKMLRIAFKNKNVTTYIKYKCVFDKKFEKWKPIEQV